MPGFATRAIRAATRSPDVPQPAVNVPVSLSKRVERLVSHPASSSHRQLSDAELAAAGLTPGMLRVSVGLEDPEDVIEDLAAAGRVG